MCSRIESTVWCLTDDERQRSSSVVDIIKDAQNICSAERSTATCRV